MQFLQNVNEPKEFHFLQIPDKTNDVIFLKSPKTCFWVIFYHFGSFLPDWDFFPKSQTVTPLQCYKATSYF